MLFAEIYGLVFCPCCGKRFIKQLRICGLIPARRLLSNAAIHCLAMGVALYAFLLALQPFGGLCPQGVPIVP